MGGEARSAVLWLLLRLGLLTLEKVGRRERVLLPKLRRGLEVRIGQKVA